MVDTSLSPSTGSGITGTIPAYPMLETLNEVKATLRRVKYNRLGTLPNSQAKAVYNALIQS